MSFRPVVGNMAILNFVPGFVSDNNQLFQVDADARLVYAKIIDIDQFGIWIENPNWQATRPDGNVVFGRIKIYVKFENIASVGCFDEAINFGDSEDFLPKEIRKIGFSPAT